MSLRSGSNFLSTSFLNLCQWNSHLDGPLIGVPTGELTCDLADLALLAIILIKPANKKATGNMKAAATPKRATPWGVFRNSREKRYVACKRHLYFVILSRPFTPFRVNSESQACEQQIRSGACAERSEVLRMTNRWLPANS